MSAKPVCAAEIVDLGAGRGTFAAMLRARGLNVSCVEPDPENHSILRELGFDVFSSMEECESESLDYVYSLNVLEHVPDDQALLKAVFSRLRAGGQLFVFVPAFPLLWSQLDDYVAHQRRYRRTPLSAMLRQTGFIVERARYADCLGFLAALLAKCRAAIDLSVRTIWLYDRLLFPASKFLDPILGHFFGKNVAIVCRKPERGCSRISTVS
jgi:SAM-dependent methyltransferase